ncbi:MAG: general stress protein [Candidatus Tectimicrobiota bacterium]|nr:MAG: general stress protein [Candidatus Tectomicrobia bacterium]
MQYRRLGKTGLQVSEIGFGAWAIGGNKHGHSYGPTDNAESLRAIARALDLGCTFFDTADIYGHGLSEKLLGQALQKRRHQCVIATKVGNDFYHGRFRKNFDADYIRFALEKSLKRLRTDYIDLYQLHNPPLMLLERAEHYAVLDELKQQGKIRAYGVSVHDPYEGMMAIYSGKPEVIQVTYNVLRPEAREELFPLAQAHDVGIIVREPLANGLLTGKYTAEAAFAEGDFRAAWPREYLAALVEMVNKVRFLARAGERTLAQAALRFVLDEPAVSVVIPGIKTVAQAEENLAASHLPPLSAAERAAIREALGAGLEDFLAEG